MMLVVLQSVNRSLRLKLIYTDQFWPVAGLITSIEAKVPIVFKVPAKEVSVDEKFHYFAP